MIQKCELSRAIVVEEYSVKFSSLNHLLLLEDETYKLEDSNLLFEFMGLNLSENFWRWLHIQLYERETK